MATLTIEGKKVKVEDAFLQMSPQEQQQAVEEIASSMGLGAKQQSRDYQPSGINGVEMPLMDRFNTFVNSAVDQIPIVGPTLSDFGAGVDAAWASMIEGKPVTKEERLAINRSQEQEYPIENVAGRVTGVVAPFMAAAPYAGASRLLGMSGNTGSRMGFGAASGGMISGADTLARGGDAEQVLTNTAVGAGVGGAFPLLEKGGRMVFDAMRGSPMIAAPTMKVASALTGRDKVTAAMVEARLKDLGPGSVIADVGENVQGQAAALATMPGTARTIIADTLKPREAAKNARIIGDVDAALGPAPVPSQVIAGNRANMDAVGPLYQEAFRGARAVDTTDIANNIDAAIVNLRGDAQTALKRVRPMLDVHGAPGNLDPSPETLFQTRQAIDGLLATEANPKVIAALSQVRSEVDAVLAEAVPGIKHADAQWAELARQNEALTAGQRTLSSGPEAIPPADLDATVAAGSQPAALLVGPSGVAFRLSQGARAEIERIIGTTANDVNALKTALKGDGSWNRQKLVTLFGEDKTRRLIAILDREQAWQATHNAAFGNSKTAATQAAQKEFSPEVAGLPTSTTLTGLIASMLTRGVGAAAGAAKTAGNEEAARLLMSDKLTPQLTEGMKMVMRELRPSLFAPAAPAVGVTTHDKRPPLQILVRGGANSSY